MKPKPVDREQERFFEELDHARILHDIVKKRCPDPRLGETIGDKIATLRRWQRMDQKRRQANERRRARKAEVIHEHIDRQAIILRDKSICWLCGKTCHQDEIHLDHVIPLSLDGPHTAANIRVACSACNIRKGATHPDDLHNIFPYRYSPSQK